MKTKKMSALKLEIVFNEIQTFYFENNTVSVFAKNMNKKI